MAYKLVLKPGAENDLLEAIEWHEQQATEGLEVHFYEEVSKVLDDIARYPEHFQKRYREVRIRFTTRFRYGIHYTLEANTVYVHAIYHTSRRPEK
ncbi:MAG: type II toxin-antitoxin system RelE/ParE family toxin [Owenweeksia sp.]|nr:type II toxin-antitoxin system RelE/ParE family toxin [Owenweeksia sp.]